MRILEIYLNDEYFNYNIIPKLICKYVKKRYDKMNKDKQLDLLNEYIKENYKIDLNYIINNFKDCIQVNRYGETYLIDINKVINNTDIIRLLEYGNRDIKGTNIISKSIKDFRDNVIKVYKLYMKGIVKDGD